MPKQKKYGTALLKNYSRRRRIFSMPKPGSLGKGIMN